MNWLQRQLIGRYGNDQLSIAILIFSFVLMLIASIFGLTLLMYLSYLPLAICIYRTLSRNIEKRRLENRKFMKIASPLFSFVNRIIRDIKDRKIHKYFHCPSCKQRLRLPKGKGEIIITCPKCHTKFTRKT